MFKSTFRTARLKNVIAVCLLSGCSPFKFNPLRTKLKLRYVKIQSVPRTKHTPSQL
jgi:hypothetical protein